MSWSDAQIAADLAAIATQDCSRINAARSNKTASQDIGDLPFVRRALPSEAVVCPIARSSSSN